MNFIDMFLLNLILVSVPLLIYMIYFTTNQNINEHERKYYLSFALISSYYLMVRYGTLFQNDFIAFFTGIIIFFLLLYRMYPATIFVMITTIILYYNQIFLWISYSLIITLTLIYEQKKISKNNFISIFITSYMICFLLWRLIKEQNLGETFFLIFMFLSLVYTVSVIYQKGTIVLATHLKYKELQKEKQIRLSLFKITHEIKNPIAVCKAYLDMYDVNNIEHSKKYIPVIKGEIERLLVLLQDFLLINKTNMNLDIMDINMLLDEVKQSVDDLMDKNKIEFNIKTIDDELFINGDYNRLGQVLINILKNSIEAMPNKIDLVVNVKDDKLFITIDDDGIGIPKDILNKIYEPFYTTKRYGTGLGVSLSNEIITAHDGTLKYESEVGSGTNVKIVLPTYNEI